MKHEFTKTIKQILVQNFSASGEQIFSSSELIQYLNIKTKAANKGSKSRGSFANLYAIYVLLEDYLLKNFHQSEMYSEVSRYMECIEEIINVALVIERFEEAVAKGYLSNILNEIIKHSRWEFNYEEKNLAVELLETSL
ncbi:hypothetical protein IQ270_23095 [Microcoleus sp. LEGE 07076]|nr:hypothetical protein [Microcoleus sp. LEGE 07076]